MAALSAQPLKADTFTFNLTGTGVSASGTFTAVQSATVLNGWNVTGMTGQVNGITIAQVVPGSWNPASLDSLNLPNFYFNYDNVLYGSIPHFDFGGILFELSDSVYVNFYEDPVLGDTYLDSTNTRVALSNFTSNVPLTATPEPSSITLLGLGALGFAQLLRRRFSA